MTRLFLIIVFFFTASWTTAQGDKLFVNYRKAIKNSSTFQYFLVITIKDLNTGESREICTKGDFLQGAIHKEYGFDYGEKSTSRVEKMALRNRKMYFEFKNPDALKNLGLDKYTIEELKNFEIQINIDHLIKKIKKGWSIKPINNKEMLLYAHALFKRGILTGENNCYGGTLELVSK